MKKIISIILVSIFLLGCEPYAKEVNWPVVPEELKDCKFFVLQDSSGAAIQIVRCPLSDTSVTYKQGKQTANTVTIDGVKYVPSP